MQTRSILITSIWSFLMILQFTLSSQNQVVIGTGTYQINGVPTYGYYAYDWSQNIYTSNEIGTSGTITKVAFKVVNTSSGITYNNQKLYLGTTSNSAFSSAGYQTPTTLGLTEVYSGNITYINGWVELTLTTPFVYSQGSNLIIALENRHGINYNSYPNFECSTISTNQTRYYYNYYQSNAFYVGNGYTSAYKPNVRLTLQSTPNDLSADQWVFPQNGATASATMPVMVKVKNVGTVAQSNFIVKYSVNGGSTFKSKTVTSSVSPNANTTVTFSTLADMADMSSSGVYQCQVVVKNTGDTVTENDTLRENITICNGSFSGAYTVGADTSANFPTITSALNAIAACGASGPITLKLKPGTYNGQLRIGNYSFITASTPLTITSESGIANDVTFQYNATSVADNYVLRIDTIGNVNIKYITFKALNLSYGNVVYINGSSNVLVEGCKIIGTNYNNATVNTLVSIYPLNYTINKNVIIKNNDLSFGSNGIYSNATTGYEFQGLKIMGNKFRNNLNSAIYLNYTDSVTITTNDINDFNSSNNAISLNYNNYIKELSRNKIVTNSATAIFLNYCVASSTNPSIVANNFIHQKASTNYAVRVNYGNYINFYYNTIHVKGSSSYAAFYNQNGAYLTLRNNNFVHMGGGYAFYTYNSGSSYISSSNYNNFYSTGSYLARYASSYYSTISSITSAQGLEANSMSNNISFYSDEDLHIMGSSLNNAGTPISAVTVDYDGQTRSTTTPDIGADEYDVYAIDGGLLAFTNLTSSCAGSATTFGVSLKNFGSTSLTSATIGWSVNGHQGSPFNWTGILGSLNSTNTNIGSYNFSADTTYNLKAWIISVNGSSDPNSFNDSTSYSNYHTSLSSGTYVIGSSSGAHFSSIQQALDIANQYGICGPVVFQIQNGTYDGQYTIGNMAGLSATNTLTFESLSGNANDVTLSYNGSSQYFVFYLLNTQYIKFKNLTLYNTSTYYSTAIAISNSQHISISNCKFNSVQYSGSIYYNYIINIQNSDYVSISNSTFNNTNGIYNQGNSSNYNTNISVLNNTFTNVFGYGAYNNYSRDSLNYIGNTISTGTGSNGTYGLYFYFCEGPSIVAKNKIYLSGTGYNALHFQYHNYNSQSAAKKTDVYNNVINIENITYTGARGINAYYSYYSNFYYNTIIFKNNTISYNHFGFYSYNNYYSNFKNNNIDIATSYPAYIYGSTLTSNYNNYYSTLANPFYYNGSYYTFATYKSYSGNDANSKTVNPTYVGTNDFHLYDAQLNNAGTTVSGITTDYDGETRHASTPDIGADEFSILSYDIAMHSVNFPKSTTALGSNPIKVAIKNLGANTIYFVTLSYQIDGGAVSSFTYGGSLSPLAIDSMIQIGTVTLTAGNHTLKTWSSNPNNTTDQNKNNDTLVFNFTAQVMPQLVVSPNPVIANINTCNGSTTVPVHIINTGGANLTFTSTTSATMPYDSSISYYYTTTGQTFNYSFPVSNSSADTINLTVTTNGDYDSSSEYVTLYVEGTSIGTFSSGYTNTDRSQSFALTGSNLATWLADGVLNVTLVNSSSVNTGYGTGLNKIQIQMAGSIWLSTSSATSGTVIPNDTTTQIYSFNANGISNGTYTGFIKLVTNVSGNTTTLIPCTLNVAGSPIISPSKTTLAFGSTFTNVAKYDSIYIRNTGCTTLTISNITSGNAAFVPLTTTGSIAIGDSLKVIYKFLTSTSGSFATTSTINGNATAQTINITGNATVAPYLAVSPNPINVTIPHCNDSSTVNLLMQNTGGGILNAAIEATKDSVEVIILTYNAATNYLTNMKAAMSYTYSKYNYVEYSTLSSTGLQSLITARDADVIIIALSNSASSFSVYANVLQTFVNGGGTVVIVGDFNGSMFTATGLISGTRINYCQNVTFTTQNTTDPITYGFPSSYSTGSDYYNYYQFTSTNVTSLVKYGSYDIAVRRTYGAGKVIAIGNYFYNTNENPESKKLISNSIKSAESQGANWIHFTPSTHNIAGGGSYIKPIVLSAAGMATGVYTASIKLSTNSPSQGVIYVPCTLTVQNQMTLGVNLGADTTSCGALTLDAGSGYATYLWNTGNTTQTISAATTGTYTVTVTNGTYCSSSDSKVVTVNPIPSINLTTLPTTACSNGTPITLTATPTGGVYAGTGISGNTFNPVVAGVGTHTIFYNYTNSYNCSNSASKAITVYAPPTVSFTGLATDYCPNAAPSTLVGTPSGGTFSGPGVVGNLFKPNIAGSGVKNVIYSFTDSHSCTNKDTNTTTVYTPTFTIAFSGLQTNYCINGGNVTLSATPAGGTFSGDGVTGTTFSPSVAGLGNHYIKYSKTDVGGCLIKDSALVTVRPLPTGLSITGLAQTFCANGAAVTLSGAPSGGTFTGTGISGNSFNPTIAGAGNHVIAYSYTNSYGCSNATTATGYVEALPTITFQNLQSSYCANDPAFTITALPTGGTLTGDEIIGNQFSPSYSGAGSFKIYYAYTSTATNCSNTDSFNIIVNSIPTVNINNVTATSCSNAIAITLSATPAGGTYSGAGVSGNTYNPTTAGLGLHSIVYSYTNANGCANTDTTQNTVVAVHNVDAGNPASINYNTSTQLSGLISGGSGNYSLAWTPASLLNNAGALSPTTVNLTSTTNFTITVNDNGTGCVNSDDVTITIIGGQLTGNISLTKDTLCVGESTQITAMGSGGLGGFTYSWSSNPAGFTSTNAIINVAPTVNTTYSCLISDGTNNITKNTPVVVNPTPAVQIGNLLTSYCNNESATTLTLSPAGGSLTGNGISGNSFNPQTASLGNNTIIYNFTNSFGCKGSDTVVVLVKATPTAYAGADTTLPCLNGGIALGQQPVSGVSYLWSPSIGLSSITVANPTSTPNLSINYLLVATHSNGCTASDGVNITVLGGPTASASNDTTICAYQPVILTASGGSTFFWSNGGVGDSTTVNPGTSTLYYVIVSANGCADLDTVYVNVSQPNPYLGADTSLCGGKTLNLNAGAGYVSYLWSNGAPNQATANVDTLGYGFGKQTIILQVTDTLGCTGSDIINVTFLNCTSLNPNEGELFTVLVYPNPSKGTFVLESNPTSMTQMEMLIMDAQSKLILSKKLQSNGGSFKEYIDLSNQPKGVYFIRLKNNNKEEVLRMIIQ